MPVTIAGKNIMLDALALVGVKAGLHSLDPGSTGANEVSGGSYARQTITWSPAADANLDSANLPKFDVPADTWVRFYSVWSEAGVLLATGAVKEPEYFANAGQATLTDADIDLLN